MFWIAFFLGAASGAASIIALRLLAVAGAASRIEEEWEARFEEAREVQRSLDQADIYVSTVGAESRT